MNAFDNERVRIDVVSDIEADIVIVAAGVTSPISLTRRDLGAANRVIFEHISNQCLIRLSEALFLVVSNPVELADKVFSFAVDRKRVIGIEHSRIHCGSLVLLLRISVSAGMKCAPL